MKKRATIPVLERIERGRVIEANGCHSFRGRTDCAPAIAQRDVYPPQLISRILMGLTPGDGLEVLHQCDTTWCINKEHMRVGTHADNMAEMAARRRSNRGEWHPLAKLREQDVRDIRDSPLSNSYLAKVYGVHRETIRSIKDRRTWGYLE